MITVKVDDVKMLDNSERIKGLRVPIKPLSAIIARVNVLIDDQNAGTFTGCLLTGATELIVLPSGAFSGSDASGFMPMLDSVFRVEDVTKDAAETVKAMAKTKIESLVATSPILRSIEETRAVLEKAFLEKQAAAATEAAATTTETTAATENTADNTETSSTTTSTEEAANVAETSNPGVAGRVVGTFTDPKTSQEVTVLAKEGESDEDAMARVRKHHGL